MKLRTYLFIPAVLLLLTGLTGNSNDPGSDINLPEKGLCAHRGAMATHPENTITAFREAIKAGAHMIEFDVFLSKDNEMVVIHDETVDRTTNGTGKISDLALEQIKGLDAGSWKSPEFEGEKIPTLDEVLKIMPVNIWLNIHIKGEGNLPAMVARKLAREKRLHQAFLACSGVAARMAREAVPKILICNMDRQESNSDYVNETIRMKADFIQLIQPISTTIAGYVKILKDSRIRVNFFGTDSPDEIRTLFEYGVDFPLVNDITHCISIAEELGILPVKASFAEGQSNSGNPNGKRILAIGDSNGAAGDGWVEQLKNLQPDNLVFNTSVSGNTIGFDNNGQKSLNTLRNVDRFMNDAVERLGGLDDIVIMLGTNDCKAVFNDSLKMVPKNFNKLLKKIRDHQVYKEFNPSIIVVSPPPVGRDEIMIEKYHGGADRIKWLQPKLRKISKKNRAEYIDIYSKLLPEWENLSKDGIHVQPEGQKIIANMIYNSLDK